MPRDTMMTAAGDTAEPAEPMGGDMSPEQENQEQDGGGYGEDATMGTVPLSFFGDTPPKEGATETVKIVSVDQQSGTVDIVCVRGEEPQMKGKGSAGLADEFNS